MTHKTYPRGTVRALVETDFVTPATRAVLKSRLVPDDAPPLAVSKPRFFDAEAFDILRAACARLIPQADRPRPVDLAGALDERLAEGKCDGWRYSQMPPDGEAHRLGLRGLNESAQAMFDLAFHVLDASNQDEVLLAVQRNEAPGRTWKTIPAGRFFEELLAELTECFYSDPLTLEEIGYVGFADAHGWNAIGLNELEAHEPRAVEDTADGGARDIGRR
ncbi:MAG TPA: gluconate 2-dehydrogenase subunit 3 family protein [Pyrinomonadaceae bacterium]